jgi:hypothetical protein
MRKTLSLMVCASLMAGCATLNELASRLGAPQFEPVDDRPAELRLIGPSTSRRSGGATVRIWTRVRNPNPFSLTLRTLEGTLFLEGARAATTEFPLGLPLRAREEAIVPLDVTIGFDDLPNLGDALLRAAIGSAVAYRLDGRVQVDAGQLGQPTFGPMTILEGDLRVAR